MENRPDYLTEMAYEWCTVICEVYQDLADGQRLLLLCLEVGFHHLDLLHLPRFKGTQHHHRLMDIVFKSEEDAAIEDLLLALFSMDMSCELCRSPDMWTKYLEHLHIVQPFSSRLRKHLLHFIQSVGYQELKGVGTQASIALLEDLHIGGEDVDWGYEMPWIRLLLDIAQSPDATQLLSYHYWELLVELSILKSRWLQLPDQYILSAQVMVSLEDAQEWDKLECWVGVVWINWPPENIDTGDSREMEDGGVTGRGLEDIMLSLFHNHPGVIQRLQKLMGKCKDTGDGFIVPELFEKICKQMHLNPEQQDIQWVPFVITLYHPIFTVTALI